MSAAAIIQCRVTPQKKEALRSLAKKERISESALVTQLLDTLDFASRIWSSHIHQSRSDQI